MSFQLPPHRPALMGILNTTPDSFSDGGLYLNAQAAIDAGLRMVEEGADLIDVGGESTRPGAEPVPLEEELARTIPVIEGLASRGVTVSIDTFKPEVARQALASGAEVVNDITALSSPKMVELCAEAGCIVCLMHMQGEPRTMQANPTYGDVVREVREFLLDAAARAESSGVAKERIWIDPGIGFGKALNHNVALLSDMDSLVSTGYPVLIGVSRKSWIGRLAGGEGTLPVEERLPGTLAAQVLAQSKGARIIRAHDVREARQAMMVAGALLAPWPKVNFENQSP